MIFDIENWLWKSDLGTFRRPMWTSEKVKSKHYYSFTDFLLKSSPCWLTSAKLHHWGHTKKGKPIKPNQTIHYYYRDRAESLLSLILWYTTFYKHMLLLRVWGSLCTFFSKKVSLFYSFTALVIVKKFMIW